MNIAKYILPGLLLSIALFSVEAEAKEFDIWKVRTLKELDINDDSFAYRSFSSDVRKLKDTRKSEFDVFVEKHAKDPILFYIRGWLGSQDQGFYHYDLQKAGQLYNRYSPGNQALIKEYQSYYRKALDLDDAPDAPDHLTATMLSTMGDDVLAAADIKERAYRKAIALAQAGKANVANENYEYTTWQFLLESYSAQKNPDKYLATLNEMIARFGISEELERYKRHVEEVITERDRMAALADTYAQTTEPYAEVAKTEPVAEPYAAPKAVEEKPKAEAAKSEESKQPESMQEPGVPEKDNSLILFLAGGAVILVGLVGWLATRRKRK